MVEEKKNIESEIENEGDEVRLEGTCEIELPQIDISKYIGKKTKIELVTEHQGAFGYFVKVQSVIIDTITGRKQPIELRASRIFGLQENDENQIGWGKTTKLGLFLKKMRVSHYKDLVGKEIVVQSMTNKDGREFLTFN
jgi:hypothetical protein